MPRKRKAFSKTVEESGVAVRIYERVAGGVLYREVRDGAGRKDRKSLGHADRALAEAQARQLARRLAELQYAGALGPVTLGQLALLHQRHRLPELSAERQRTIKGQLPLLLEHFGRELPVHDLTPALAEGYAAARTAGRVRSPRHRGAAPGVRAGTVRNELHLLRAMLRWARQHRAGGRPLLSADPLEGVTVPHEKNMRRPVATEARYRKLLAVADAVEPLGRFRCLLVLARTTGRRINALCALKASEVLRTRESVEAALAATGQDLRHAAHWPHGALRFRASTDKLGFESVVPISADARDALDRYLQAHPRVGDAPLFPARSDGARAAHKVLAGYWLRRAELRAELPKMERGAWHAFRRLWASERRHLPAQDVAAGGGWRSLEVMRTAYQHADALGVYAAVSGTADAPAKGRKAPNSHRRGHTRDTAESQAADR
jgi:integrase